MSIIKSIGKSFCPIHPAGYPFIAIFFVISLALGFLWLPLFWVGFVLTLWCVYFFRDPKRTVPQGQDLVISPADGFISFAGLSQPPAELGLGQEPMQRISVFMNVFSCHVNRSPMAGKIRSVIYRPGKFINAELDKASEHNERNGLVIATHYGDIGVVQIAGLIARRILCWAKEGEDLPAGKRFGLIRFGSRVDVYLPAHARLRVGVGQKAVAGETILALFGEHEAITHFHME